VTQVQVMVPLVVQPVLTPTPPLKHPPQPDGGGSVQETPSVVRPQL